MDSMESALLVNYNLTLEQARKLNAIEDNETYTRKINSILQQ